MAEPIKHAPGVVCIIKAPSDPGFHNNPQHRAAAIEAWGKLNGRVCTITAPSPGYVRIPGYGIVDLPLAPGEPVWVVAFDSPAVTPIEDQYGIVRNVESNELAFKQSALVPIAGPGIDTSEPTSVETSAPTQSPVPETTP